MGVAGGSGGGRANREIQLGGPRGQMIRHRRKPITDSLLFKILATVVATALVKVPLTMLLVLTVPEHKIKIGYWVMFVYAVGIAVVSVIRAVPPATADRWIEKVRKRVG